MNKLQLSGRVFWEVGQEFLGTVFGTTKKGLSSFPCGAVSSDNPSMTSFYLDPFAEGECACVDFVGKDARIW